MNSTKSNDATNAISRFAGRVGGERPVIPVKTGWYETAQYPFLQSWAVELVILKVWTRFIACVQFKCIIPFVDNLLTFFVTLT